MHKNTYMYYKQWHTGDFFNMSASHYLQYSHFYIYSCHKLSLKFYMRIGCTGLIFLCVNISQRMEIYRWNMQESLCTAYWLCVILYISCTFDIFVNCNWVVTRWQYTFTHKQYIQQYKTTIHTTTQQFWKSAGRAPSWLVLPWHLPYNRGKSTEKPQSG